MVKQGIIICCNTKIHGQSWLPPLLTAILNGNWILLLNSEGKGYFFYGAFIKNHVQSKEYTWKKVLRGQFLTGGEILRRYHQARGQISRKASSGSQREGAAAVYAHLAVGRWRGSRRAAPLAPKLDVNHIPMEMLQFLQHTHGRKLSNSIGCSLTLYLRIKQTR